MSSYKELIETLKHCRQAKIEDCEHCEYTVFDEKFGHYVCKANKLTDDVIEALENLVGTGGTYECFHCLHRSVVWQCDYDFSDYGYDGEGIVQVLHCANCGAEIEYMIPMNIDEQNECPVCDECPVCATQPHKDGNDE